MSKYIYLYRGPATPTEQMAQDQTAEIMQQWKDWMDGLGGAMKEMGNPFGERAAVVDDGSTSEPADLNGYTIVEADSLDAAKAMVDQHPFLTEGKGRFAVDVFELVQM
jgi:hypothetical protein